MVTPSRNGAQTFLVDARTRYAARPGLDAPDGLAAPPDDATGSDQVATPGTPQAVVNHGAASGAVNYTGQRCAV